LKNSHLGAFATCAILERQLVVDRPHVDFFVVLSRNALFFNAIRKGTITCIKTSLQ